MKSIIPLICIIKTYSVGIQETGQPRSLMFKIVQRPGRSLPLRLEQKWKVLDVRDQHFSVILNFERCFALVKMLITAQKRLKTHFQMLPFFLLWCFPDELAFISNSYSAQTDSLYRLA